MVAIDRAPIYPSVHLNDLISQTLAQKEQMLPSTGPPPNNQSKIRPEHFGLDRHPSLQFATKGGGYVQVFGPLQTPGNDKFFHDPNPLVIRKKSKPVTYVQKIQLGYYNPPAPPAPGPIIIKEVRPPQAPQPPPLYVRIQPPAPQQQEPLVIREAPPQRPQQVPATVLTKMLPQQPIPPPRVTVRNAPNRETAQMIAQQFALGNVQQQ